MEYILSVIVCQALFLSLDLVILWDTYKNREFSRQQQYFHRFAVAVVAQQGLAMLSQMSESDLWNPGAVICNLIYIGLFTAMTACSYDWFLYLLSLSKGEEISRGSRILYGLPVALMGVTSLASPLTHWVFYIDAGGVYQRGSLFILQMICPYIYILLAVILAAGNRRSGDKTRTDQMLRYFISFLFPSMLCVLVQQAVVEGGYPAIGISIGLILIYLELYIEEVNESRRLKSIEALNQKLQRYSSILEAATPKIFCIYWVDLVKNRMTEARALAAMTEKTGREGEAAAFMQTILDNFVIPEDREAMADFADMSRWQERFRESDIFTCEYRGITSAWSRCSAIAAERDPGSGQVTEVVLTAETIHEEIRTREVLSRAVRDAEEANAAKTSFLFHMSHDIRTPMNAILGFRDLLEKYQEDPVRRADYLGKINDAGKVLLSIINNVLEMARIEKGTLEIEETVWSAEEFSEDMYSVFRDMMEQKQLTFTKKVDVRHSRVWCDKLKLREIFINILSNACKYTDAGGRVDMAVEEIPCERDGWTVYQTTITDTGIGMSEEFLPHIFEEFSREQTTTEGRVEGTGLGMPIVKRMVDLLGGTIEVQSTKGEGSSFRVAIPHRIAEESGREEKKNPAENEEPGETAGQAGADPDSELLQGRHILMAEDNDLNAEITREILGGMGIIVERAEDGDVCVNMLQQSEPGTYDLVLMDIQMPRMNGYEAARAIRSMEDPRKAGIPILAMTANAFEEDKREAFRAGMDGHLAKPVNMDELRRTLSGLLSQNG